jgi:HAD superfamily hydrolase (TIGR01509 family)
MRFDAVLFDCDGVLVDSESITCGVLRDMLEEQGWSMSLQQCMNLFIGKMVADERLRIERETGKPFTQEWLTAFRERRNDALETRIEAIPHVHDAVQRIFDATGGRIACASGADRFKVELVLRKVGLLRYFEGRVFSGHETPRSKPFPDVYLAAAAALGIAPQRCAVVEDTLVGLQAGVAAGAAVFAYVPQGSGQAFLDAGATAVLSSMVDLHALLT